MRIVVFFDLPVKTKTRRRDATRVRNFLLMDGYPMLQSSVSARVCNGMAATERQYEAIDVHLGKLSEAADTFQCKQLSIF